MFNIKKQLEKLPQKPGVYLMKDKNNNIIYVGKSKNLSKRVRSYFTSFNSKRSKVQTLVKNIYEFEYFITDTEKEALILESNLIKKHNPRFNILLRDDKQYPYIKITINEKYPRLFMTREFRKDGSKYFGPYTNVNAVKTTIDAIHDILKLRKCNLNLNRKNLKVCLNYHIDKCLGPCQFDIDVKKYNALVKKAIDILNGNQQYLINKLKFQMKKSAKDLNFEVAAEYRDRLESIKKLKEKQKINSVKGDIYDVISYYKGDLKICIMVFFIRGGKLIGRDKFTFDLEKENIINSFVTQFYTGAKLIPKKIYIKDKIENQSLIVDWLTELKGKKVDIKVPKIGEKKKQIDLVTKNSKEFLTKFEEKINFEKKFVNSSKNELKNILKVKSVERIEAYDISNIYGVYSVGSMVVYENGKKKPNGYRRFKIKTVEGADDYLSMQEILFRRFNRGLDELEKIKEKSKLKENFKFNIFPDILFIDGGKGHVNATKKVLKALEIDIPVCGMVKDDYHKTEALFYNGKKIYLKKYKYAFKLVSQIQEEVHRFAINYHKSVRKKHMTKSILDEISGIGKKRKIKLMKHFKKIENIKNASIEQLIEVNGISKNIANKIFKFFNE
ncbi:MAG: excinuclease ABC subunit UvrC [Bacillota bacterium]